MARGAAAMEAMEAMEAVEAVAIATELSSIRHYSIRCRTGTRRDREAAGGGGCCTGTPFKRRRRRRRRKIRGAGAQGLSSASSERETEGGCLLVLHPGWKMSLSRSGRREGGQDELSLSLCPRHRGARPENLDCCCIPIPPSHLSSLVFRASLSL